MKNSYRFLTLLLSLLLLVTLFAGCQNAPADEPANDDANTPDDNSGADQQDDSAPAEVDAKTIEWLGFEFHNYKYTADDAKAKNFETLKAFEDLALNDYKLEIDWSTVDQSAYQTTINGLLASHALPDSYCGGFFTEDVYNSVYLNGGFAAMDDVLEYAPECAHLFAEGGPLAYAKAWMTMENGEWYTMRPGNNTATSMDLSTDTMKQRVPFQVHGTYALAIRQDWLNKLGLDMPQTKEEFQEALVQFREQDVNGNGAQDERYVAHLGTTGVYAGVAQWFGLPYGNMVENPGTGVIESPYIMEGYKPWLTYMRGLYDDLVLYNNDGGAVWQYAVYCAGNYASAYTVMNDNLWATETGDPDADYEPLPLIQAVDGIVPRYIVQEAVAGGVGFTFNSEVDLDAAGRFMDFLHSEKYFYLKTYGIEGVAWDWTEDGLIKRYTLEEDMDGYKGAGGLWLDFNAFPDVGIANVWGLGSTQYKSVEEALDAGECYTEKFMTEEEWKESVGYNGVGSAPSRKTLEYISAFGSENFAPAGWYNFLTPPTSDEVAVNSMYRTDLDTYLLEMTTTAITGQISIDEVDEKLQYAYDTLGLQECIDVAQARYNRFLVAMGLDPVKAE